MPDSISAARTCLYSVSRPTGVGGHAVSHPQGPSPQNGYLLSFSASSFQRRQTHINSPGGSCVLMAFRQAAELRVPVDSGTRISSSGSSNSGTLGRERLHLSLQIKLKLPMGHSCAHGHWPVLLLGPCLQLCPNGATSQQN